MGNPDCVETMKGWMGSQWVKVGSLLVGLGETPLVGLLGLGETPHVGLLGLGEAPRVGIFFDEHMKRSHGDLYGRLLRSGKIQVETGLLPYIAASQEPVRASPEPVQETSQITADEARRHCCK
ncbi:unnamed protein product [Merluccius merluccius]